MEEYHNGLRDKKENNMFGTIKGNQMNNALHIFCFIVTAVSSTAYASENSQLGTKTEKRGNLQCTEVKSKTYRQTIFVAQCINDKGKKYYTNVWQRISVSDNQTTYGGSTPSCKDPLCNVCEESNPIENPLPIFITYASQWLSPSGKDTSCSVQ